jgi:hypothetical protein
MWSTRRTSLNIHGKKIILPGSILITTYKACFLDVLIYKPDVLRQALDLFRLITNANRTRSGVMQGFTDLSVPLFYTTQVGFVFSS